MKTTLLVLTLNEIDGMRQIMPLVDRAWCDQIIIVDGGSTDGTVEWAREQGYEVHIQSRRGIRHAYFEVFPKIAGDIVISFSPDGNCPVEAIPRLQAKMAEGYDLVIASRYLSGAHSDDDDLMTAFGNWLFTRTVNLLHGGHYTDVMVILRAFRKSLVTDLDLMDDAAYALVERLYGTVISWEPLMSVRAAKWGARIAEIPADEPARIGGERKLQMWRWGAAYYSQFWRELWFWRRVRNAASKSCALRELEAGRIKVKDKYAPVAENVAPNQADVAAAFALAREIIRCTEERTAIIKTAGLDSRFAVPDANWAASAPNDYIKTYRLVAKLDWNDVRLLRLRCSNFTGTSLVKMGSSQGLHTTDPIPEDFESAWTEEQYQILRRHWQSLTANTPPEMFVRPANMLGECGWWIDDVIVNPDTIAYQERMSLLYENGVIARLPPRCRVLEIGGGYGALASALVTILQPAQYVICDLPESLLFSGLYLSLIGSTKPRLAQDGALPEGLVLLPNYWLPKAIAGAGFDLVINTLSLSEMSEYQIAAYCAMISAAIGPAGTFFEQNQDNAHLGVRDFKAQVSAHFGKRRSIALSSVPVTQGRADLWSN